MKWSTVEMQCHLDMYGKTKYFGGGEEITKNLDKEMWMVIAVSDQVIYNSLKDQEGRFQFNIGRSFLMVRTVQQWNQLSEGVLTVFVGYLHQGWNLGSPISVASCAMPKFSTHPCLSRSILNHSCGVPCSTSEAPHPVQPNQPCPPKSASALVQK